MGLLGRAGLAVFATEGPRLHALDNAIGTAGAVHPLRRGNRALGDIRPVARLPGQRVADDQADTFVALLRRTAETGVQVFTLDLAPPSAYCEAFATPADIGDDPDALASIWRECLSRTVHLTEVSPPSSLELTAGPALYSEFEHPDGTQGAVYAVLGAGVVYFMHCRADARPEDDWLSIAETVEFLPAEE